jgi:hypothetical protein
MRGKFRKNKHIVMFLQTLDNYKYSLPLLKILIVSTIKAPQNYINHKNQKLTKHTLIIISASAA